MIGPPWRKLWIRKFESTLLSFSAAGETLGDALIEAPGDALSVALTVDPGAGEIPGAVAGDIPGAVAGENPGAVAGENPGAVAGDIPAGGGGICAAGLAGAAGFAGAAVAAGAPGGGAGGVWPNAINVSVT